MIIKDITLSTPQENLDYDDALLAQAEKSEAQEFLRFWESREYFICLGRISDSREDIQDDIRENKAVKILRRSSGGGTVVQGPGCLNYSLVLLKKSHPALWGIRSSYAYILEKVGRAFKECGLDVCFKPTCDLALKEGSRKFSGNAQRRGRKAILHHGTILYNFDLSRMAEYLKIPKAMPDYRQNRSHNDFLQNINVSSDKIKEALRNEFKN